MATEQYFGEYQDAYADDSDQFRRWEREDATEPATQGEVEGAKASEQLVAALGWSGVVEALRRDIVRLEREVDQAWAKIASLIPEGGP